MHLLKLDISVTLIHTYQKYNKLHFINNIYYVFFKGCVAVYNFVPVIGLMTGVSLTAGSAFAAYSAVIKYANKEYVEPLAKQYKISQEKLKDINDIIYQMQETVKAVQEEVRTKHLKMSEIFQSVNEAQIYANYLDITFDSNFDNLKKATTALAKLCTDYSEQEVGKSENERLEDC